MVYISERMVGDCISDEQQEEILRRIEALECAINNLETMEKVVDAIRTVEDF